MPAEKARRATEGPPAWILAVIVLAVYSGVAASRLAAAGWDVTIFISAGDTWTDRAGVGTPIAVGANSDGYDGQFYYRLAIDPFTGDRTHYGITLDNPATRGARLLYPLIAWMASFGHPAWLPWSMLGVNLGGMFCLAWLGVSAARRRGAPGWMGLLPAFHPGFIVTMTRDTTEIVAALLVVAAIVSAQRGRIWIAALLGSAAVVARETGLLALAGFGLAELVRCIRSRRASSALIAYSIPAFAFVGWQAVVFRHWGSSSFSGTGQNIGPPFAGVAHFFAANLGALRLVLPPPKLELARLFWMSEACLCLASFAVAAAAAFRYRVDARLCLSGGFYLALVLCLTTSVWVQPYDFLRGCTEAVMLACLIAIASCSQRVGVMLWALIAPGWLMASRWV